jgi:hypothetical protein
VAALRVDLPRLRSWAVSTNPIWQDLQSVANLMKNQMNQGLVPQKDNGDGEGNAYQYPTEEYAEMFALMSLVDPNAANRADWAKRAHDHPQGLRPLDPRKPGLQRGRAGLHAAAWRDRQQPGAHRQPRTGPLVGQQRLGQQDPVDADLAEPGRSVEPGQASHQLRQQLRHDAADPLFPGVRLDGTGRSPAVDACAVARAGPEPGPVAHRLDAERHLVRVHLDLERDRPPVGRRQQLQPTATPPW